MPHATQTPLASVSSSRCLLFCSKRPHFHSYWFTPDLSGTSEISQASRASISNSAFQALCYRQDSIRQTTESCQAWAQRFSIETSNNRVIYDMKSNKSFFSVSSLKEICLVWTLSKDCHAESVACDKSERQNAHGRKRVFLPQFDPICSDILAICLPSRQFGIVCYWMPKWAVCTRRRVMSWVASHKASQCLSWQCGHV